MKTWKYITDTDVAYLVRGNENYALLGFQEYDPDSDGALPWLPANWEMRKVNLVHRADTGEVRRAVRYVGSPDDSLWDGSGTLTLTGPGLSSSGDSVESLSLSYVVSSTTGELRRFISRIETGYSTLLHDEAITDITPVAE